MSERRAGVVLPPERPGIFPSSSTAFRTSQSQAGEERQSRRKEVKEMKYEKPEITFRAEAVEIIQGMKLNGPADSSQPVNPIHTAAAYESDE